MRSRLIPTALAVLTTRAAVLSTPALAYDRYHRIYHGRGGHYRHRHGC